jgi:hypothetical protein
MFGYEFFANLVDNIYKTESKNNNSQQTHYLSAMPYLYGNEIDFNNTPSSSPSLLPHEAWHVVQQK